MDAVTTTEAAKILQVSPRTVARACAEHGIGVMANPRLRLLTKADVDQLRGLVTNKIGNPTFGDPELARKAIQSRWDAAPKKKAGSPKKTRKSK